MAIMDGSFHHQDDWQHEPAALAPALGGRPLDLARPGGAAVDAAGKAQVDESRRQT